MNRMIKLFQQKSDNALQLYLINKQKVVAFRQPLDMCSGEICAAVTRGFDLKARHEVWAKAAELLRKEELSR